MPFSAKPSPRFRTVFRRTHVQCPHLARHQNHSCSQRSQFTGYVQGPSCCFLSRGADKPTAEGIQIDLRESVLLCVRVRGEVDKAVLHMLSGRLGEGRSKKREWGELGWCDFGKARVHGYRIKGGRRVRLLEYGMGSKMEGWRKNWSKRVGS